MFDWLGDIFSGIGNAIGDTIEYLGTQIANTIFDAILNGSMRSSTAPLLTSLP